MSLTKQEVAPSKYIDSAKTLKTDGNAIMRKAYRRAVKEQNSAYTLALLAVKHKVALLTIGNVVLVLNWAFPAWTELVKSLI